MTSLQKDLQSAGAVMFSGARQKVPQQRAVIAPSGLQVNKEILLLAGFDLSILKRHAFTETY